MENLASVVASLLILAATSSFFEAPLPWAFFYMEEAKFYVTGYWGVAQSGGEIIVTYHDDLNSAQTACKRLIPSAVTVCLAAVFLPAPWWQFAYAISSVLVVAILGIHSHYDLSYCKGMVKWIDPGHCERSATPPALCSLAVAAMFGRCVYDFLRRRRSRQAGEAMPLVHTAA